MSNTVTIGSDVFNIFGSLAGATSYMNGRFGPVYTKWRNAVADDKARSLATTCQYLDTLGLVDPASGAAVNENTAIAAVISASYELAAAIVSKPALLTNVDGGSNIKLVNAKGTSVEFFSPQHASLLPPAVLALLSPYMVATDSPNGVGESPNAGDDGADPMFNPCFDADYDRKRPL